jgi:myo-inositol-1(or 4)-monophosphatase
MVSTRLTAAYPSFDFVGEETYVAGKTKITEKPTFIVDPIDGTTNFLHGFPNACISLGLAVGRSPAVGVVYNPFQDLLFHGVRGGGAYMRLNASSSYSSSSSIPAPEDRRLPLAGAGSASGAPPLRGLGQALVVVEWGSERAGPNFDIRAEVFRQLCADRATGGAMVHSLRSLGSAALNLCAVAAGQADVYWEGGCWAWDVCAGWCVLAEAGGRMVSGNPGGWETELDSRVYLAVRGAPNGGEELVKEFWEIIGDGRLEYHV